MNFELKYGDILARSVPTPGIEVAVDLRQADRDERHYRFGLLGLAPSALLRVNGALEHVDVRVLRHHAELIPPDGSFPIQLLLETPFNLLERLERARSGGAEVVLQLRLNATVGIYVETLVRRKDQPHAAFVLGYTPRRLHELRGESLAIPRDKWLELLSRLGFRDVLVIELPRPPLPGGSADELSKVRQKLESARSSFDRADYDHVCGDVLSALESLAPGEGPAWPRLMSGPFQHLTPSVRERLQAALSGTAPLIHLGRHGGRTEAEQRESVSREHAALLLAWATLVVGWAVAGK